MSANKRGHRRHTENAWNRPELLVGVDDLATAFPDRIGPTRDGIRRSGGPRQQPALRRPLDDTGTAVLGVLIERSSAPSVSGCRRMARCALR